ncbi:MAG TPA: hypothetical protein VFO62_10705 [Candidatus Binatia bacterium]|nr:hypothetical protein [Candidatus Binatia bacterium]
MIVWSRPAVAPAGAPFCAVVQIGASVVTACRGRWEPHERDEIRWEAPEGEACGGCVSRIDGAPFDPGDTFSARTKRDPNDAGDPTWIRGAEEARERLARRTRGR